MQTITIEVKDDYLDNTLEILHGLKDIMIDEISVTCNNVIDSNEKKSFMKLSNNRLEKIWNNEEDAIYDKYLD